MSISRVINSDKRKREQSENMHGNFVKGDSAENLQAPRIWCPGSFDLFHVGHANLLRKAKQFMPGAKVVVGLYSDNDVKSLKCEPVFTEEERYAMLKSNKWVDEVVLKAPSEFSEQILEDFKCDLAVLGALESDKKADKYHALVKSGKLKLEEKFPGISTARTLQQIMAIEDRDANNNTVSGRNWGSDVKKNIGFSTREILNFSPLSIPKPEDKVVYIAGAFDLFHPGHLEILENARKLGTYLIVGVHNDETVKIYAGPKYPILSSSERYMAVLSSKHVSDVIMDAPLKITDKLISEFGIKIVIGTEKYLDMPEDENHPYAAAKKLGIFQQFNTSEIKLSTEKIVKRVHSNWSKFQDRVTNYLRENGEGTGNFLSELGDDRLEDVTRDLSQL